MPSRVKKLMCEKLVADYSGSSGLIFVSNKGLNGEQTAELRSEVRKSRMRIQVVRNRLTKLAFRKMGLEGCEKLLRGPVAIIDGGDDVVAAAKLAEAFSKKYQNLGLVGGIVEGKVLDEEGIKALAKSPGRRQLQEMIVGQIKGPVGRVPAAVLAPGAGIAAALAALVAKLEKTGQGEGSGAGSQPAPAGASS